MNTSNFAQRGRFFVLAIACLFVSLISQTTSVRAQIPSSLESASEGINFTPPPDLSGEGRPVQRKQAASQGEGTCSLNNQSSEELLMAIVPRNYGEARTVSDRPTLWFYVPYSANSFESMQFVLWNAAGETVSEITLTATSALPGVISVQPDAALQVGQSYEGRLILTCGETALTVESSIVRVAESSELTNELAAATTPQAQAATYANHHVWFEALTVLGNQRRTNSGETTLFAWSDLLADVNLDDLASKPIVDCCYP